METQFLTYYKSPVGWLKITSNDKAIKSITFVERAHETSSQMSDILIESMKQLDEYFEGKRLEFNLELAPTGSEFQHSVWKLVSQIRYGETASYLDIAIRSGSAKNTRAVGLANGKNPIPIIIPCHRVIGNKGKLTGYAGGLERKRWLLLHEQKHSSTPNRLF
jgi:methylated-DNA-[protein]-cysteine S-methyltransferase